MSADTEQYQQGDFSKNPHLTNDNMINTIMQYIINNQLDAYNMGQKSLDQNFNY